MATIFLVVKFCQNEKLEIQKQSDYWEFFQFPEFG
jgi:hypothetical protein